VEAHLRDQRRQLLERFPAQRSAEDFARLQAQVSFLDLLIDDLRDGLRAFWIAHCHSDRGSDLSGLSGGI
jgi:hypothetical protein